MKALAWTAAWRTGRCAEEPAPADGAAAAADGLAGVAANSAAAVTAAATASPVVMVRGAPFGTGATGATVGLRGLT